MTLNPRKLLTLIIYALPTIKSLLYGLETIGPPFKNITMLGFF